jgi:hypothetical protein
MSAGAIETVVAMGKIDLANFDLALRKEVGVKVELFLEMIDECIVLDRSTLLRSPNVYKNNKKRHQNGLLKM